MIETLSTIRGWVFSLSYSEESNWGDTVSFYDEFLDESQECYRVESEVWGTFLRKDYTPQPGDGIAFYHSTRALYPYNDPYGQKPRISLIGVLNDIKYEGKHLTWLDVQVELRAVKAMQQQPLVRNDATKAIFERCGIVRGPIASFYQADPTAWRQILDHLRQRMPPPKPVPSGPRLIRQASVPQKQ